MTVKLTYEYVKEKIEEKGWILLSKEYKNAMQYLELNCPNGHQNFKKYNKFQQGSGCSACSKTRKPTYNSVKEYVENLGWKLLSKEYVNAKTNLIIKCKNNHIFERTYDTLTRNEKSICKKCPRPDRTFKYKDIKKIIEENGWTLLSKEYKNCKTQLEIICPNGHYQLKSYDIFIKRIGCIECGGKKRHSYEKIKLEFENKGWKLLSKEYKNHETKLNVICPTGHKTTKTYASFNSGAGCHVCNKGVVFTYDFVKSEIENRGWKLLSKEYINCSKKLLMVCSEGHEIEKTFRSFRSDQGCINCFESEGEKKCREILEEYYSVKFKKIRPDWLNKLELDGYNEDLKLAFEYNGKQHYKYIKHYHNNKISNFISQICRDKIKKYLCKINNIKIITISYKIKLKDMKKYIHNKIKDLEQNH